MLLGWDPALPQELGVPGFPGSAAGRAPRSPRAPSREDELGVRRARGLPRRCWRRRRYVLAVGSCRGAGGGRGGAGPCAAPLATAAGRMRACYLLIRFITRAKSIEKEYIPPCK